MFSEKWESGYVEDQAMDEAAEMKSDVAKMVKSEEWPDGYSDHGGDRWKLEEAGRVSYGPRRSASPRFDAWMDYLAKRYGERPPGYETIRGQDGRFLIVCPDGYQSIVDSENEVNAMAWNYAIARESGPESLAKIHRAFPDARQTSKQKAKKGKPEPAKGGQDQAMASEIFALAMEVADCTEAIRVLETRRQAATDRLVEIRRRGASGGG